MKQLIILGLSSLLLCSCKKDGEDEKMYKGAAVQVHGGKAWTWIRMSRQNVPEQLAITIEDAVLNALPTGNAHDENEHMENSFVLPLHPKALAHTPFQKVMINWAPEGHPPVNEYTRPHFDFHFYMVSAAEVAATTDPVKLETVPAADG